MTTRNIFTFLATLMVFEIAEASDTTFWRSDYEQALSEAIESDKAVLLYFTGSDWCHWCRKLDHEIFAPSSARKQLKEILIPIIFDFPQNRKEPPGKVRKNRIQKQKWSVTDFPSVIIFDPANGEELWRHSYYSTTTEDYLKTVTRLLDRVRE